MRDEGAERDDGTGRKYRRGGREQHEKPMAFLLKINAQRVMRDGLTKQNMAIACEGKYIKNNN